MLSFALLQPRIVSDVFFSEFVYFGPEFVGKRREISLCNMTLMTSKLVQFFYIFFNHLLYNKMVVRSGCSRGILQINL